MADDDVQIEEDEALKQFLPGGFGKQTKEANVAAQIERTKRATAKTIQPTKVKDKSDSEESDDDDDDDDDDDFDDE